MPRTPQMFDVILTSQSLRSRVGSCRQQLLSWVLSCSEAHTRVTSVHSFLHPTQWVRSRPSWEGDWSLAKQTLRATRLLEAPTTSWGISAQPPGQSASLASLSSAAFSYTSSRPFQGGRGGLSPSLLGRSPASWDGNLCSHCVLQTGRPPSRLWSSVFPFVKWGCWIRSAIQAGSWVQQAHVILGPWGSFSIFFLINSPCFYSSFRFTENWVESWELPCAPSSTPIFCPPVSFIVNIFINVVHLLPLISQHIIIVKAHHLY